VCARTHFSLNHSISPRFTLPHLFTSRFSNPRVQSTAFLPSSSRRPLIQSTSLHYPKSPSSQAKIIVMSGAAPGRGRGSRRGRGRQSRRGGSTRSAPSGPATPPAPTGPPDLQLGDARHSILAIQMSRSRSGRSASRVSRWFTFPCYVPSVGTNANQ
jgi:hypothetical protein